MSRGIASRITETLRYHAVEEVYELLDAIDAGDDHEMGEELGDLLLQVVFHCQLGRERKAFDFDSVCQRLVDKLVRRHPHVFGDVRVRGRGRGAGRTGTRSSGLEAGTRRKAAFGAGRYLQKLPALMRAEKLVKKARKAGLVPKCGDRPVRSKGAVASFLIWWRWPKRADGRRRRCCERRRRRANGPGVDRSRAREAGSTKAKTS